MNDAMISNRAFEEMTRLGLAAGEALTDSMVERLAVTGANALELLDRFNDETTRAAVHALLDRVTELHSMGALNTFFDTMMLLHAAKDSFNDAIIERLFTFFEQMINTVGNEEMGTLAENTRYALEDAAEETMKARPRHGLLATLALLSKPETQRTLTFLLSFAGKLQERTAVR
jgi:uncharacterized protein YjgD (DUF1641 family)